MEYEQLSVGGLWRRLSGNITVYSVGTIVSKLGMFFVVPLYWHELKPEDFGIIGITQILNLFLIPVFTMGLYDTVLRYYSEWKVGARGRSIGTLWLFSIGTSLTFCIILDLLGPELGAAIFKNVAFQPYLRIGLWTAFLSSLSFFPISIFRIREELRKFTLINFGTFLVQVLVTLYLVLVLKMGVMGYLWGAFTSAALWAIYYVYFMLKQIEFTVDFSILRQTFPYFFPVMITALFEGALGMLDRFYLDKYGTLAVIGLYTLGHQFAGSFSAVINIFKSSWTPFLFRVVSSRDDGPQVLGLFSLYSISILAFCALALSVACQDAIVVLGNQAYMGIIPYIPGFISVYLVYAFVTIFGRGLDLSKNTLLSPLIPVVGAAAAWAGMAFLVPRYGAWGALGGLFIGVAVRGSVQVHLAYRLYPRPTHWKELLECAGVLLVSSALLYVSRPENIWLRILIHALILMVTFIAVLRAAFGANRFQQICNASAKFFRSGMGIGNQVKIKSNE